MGLLKSHFYFVLMLLPGISSAHPLVVIAERGGHSGVTSSLRAGLQSLGVPYDFNHYNKDAHTVIVLAGVTPIREAIRRKKAGQIKKILVGPNVVVRADEHGSIIADPLVDACIVPSHWVQTAYLEQVPSLQGRTRIWPAGVNQDVWKASNGGNRKKVAIYWKTNSQGFIDQIKKELQKVSLDSFVIRYGRYTHGSWLSALNQSKLAIFVSGSESQGLALAEAWSMDVPTLVWNPGRLTAHGRVYSEVSSAPYLSEQTGLFWREIGELAYLLKQYVQKELTFSPRHWVLNNMTDTIAAQHLLNIIDEL